MFKMYKMQTNTNPLEYGWDLWGEQYDILMVSILGYSMLDKNWIENSNETWQEIRFADEWEN